MIKELIELKNQDEKRGGQQQKNTTLHEIPIDQFLIEQLKNQGLNLDSIMPQGQKVYLHDKFVLSHGCDIINCADIVHPDNQQLFIKAAKIFGADLIGFDFICPDISQSHLDQATAIIEANSLPYLDMHQFPSHGAAEPVAELVWDYVLSKL